MRLRLAELVIVTIKKEFHWREHAECLPFLSGIPSSRVLVPCRHDPGENLFRFLSFQCLSIDLDFKIFNFGLQQLRGGIPELRLPSSDFCEAAASASVASSV
jgi:hypothetical protein